MDFSELMAKVAEVPGGWRLVGQVFVIVFVALIADLVQRIVTRKLGDRVRATRNPWDDALFDAVRAPASALIWLIGIALAAELLARESEALVFDYVDPVREIGVIAILAWFLLRFINRMEENFIRIRQQEQRQIDQTAVDAIGKLLRASVVITAVLVLMQTLGFSVSGILAFGGLGGIAVGFAAKDMLANFFGGATVYLDKPFKVGDWIRSPDREIEGTVEHIGWRSTRIRTFDQRPLYVPNAAFTTISVENPSRMPRRRIYETIGVRHEDLGKLEGIVDAVRAMLERHEGIDREQTLMVSFDKYNAYSLDFFIYTFTTTRVWAEYHDIKQDVLFRIGRIITEHGAALAIPARILHLPGALPVKGGEPPRDRDA